jgi:beta-lactam-binding protein with PASTA domain
MRGFEARAYLESLGLKVTTVRIETKKQQQIGFVVAQDPRSGKVVTQGTTVSIFVGEPKGGGGGGGGGGG